MSQLHSSLARTTVAELLGYGTRFSGGAILVDGLLVAVDGSTKLYLIDPDPSGFKPLASAELLESGENWAPIALADGKLLIRDQKQMKCIVIAQQG